MRRPFRSRSWSQAKLRNPFRIRRRPPAAESYEGQSPETAQQLRPTHSSQIHTAPPAQQNRGPGHVRARRDLRKPGLRRKRSQCSWFFSRASEQGIAHGGDCCAAGFRPRVYRRGVRIDKTHCDHNESGYPSIANLRADIRKPPLSAMCGRLRVGKENLHGASLVGAAMCSAC